MPDERTTAIACSLSAAELGDRKQLWRAVTAAALQTKAAAPGGVRLSFQPDHQTAHRLLDLIAAERNCCGWASWKVTTTAQATLVEVTAPGEGAVVLQSMFEVVP